VEDLKPDLLRISGISQRRDIGAIQSVIEQTKKKIRCEIFLMSGPLDDDWRAPNAAGPNVRLPAMKWPGDPFNNQLAKLAKREGV